MSVTDEREQIPTLEIREGEYGERVAAVEPGGAEFIPLRERHGRPLNLFWTWMSPNLEFATIFVGVLAVAVFGLSFWAALVAIVVGSALGSLSHAVLSARGPGAGVPQMILSRVSFGHWGNALPAGLNSLTAGIGWFAVNSVSGALALNTLSHGHLPKWASLVIIVIAQIVVAFFGHNLVHVFERYAFPFLTVAFVLAGVWIFRKAHPGAWHSPGGIGGFLLTVGAAFGYAAGWNPYASDYTRYFPPRVSKRAVALWSGLGVFVSCVALEAVGAGSALLSSSGSPTNAFTSHFPTALKDYVLVAIALGAVAANVLNIYSGAMSFVALGLRLPLALRRAIVAFGFGVVGFIVAIFGLHNAGSKYENFLLIISYWIGPWLAVFFVDQYLRRGEDTEILLYDTRYANWAGPIAMLVGAAASIPLFSNQTWYTGWVPFHHPAVGDLTFEVGFLVAGLTYALLFRVLRVRTAR